MSISGHMGFNKQEPKQSRSKELQSNFGSGSDRGKMDFSRG